LRRLLANAPLRGRNRDVACGIAAYLGATVASVLAVWILYALWGVDLRYPLTPLTGDAVFDQAIVFKAMTDNRWYLDNSQLGAPFGLDMRDMPMPDLLVLAAAKCLALITKHHVLVRNLLAIASFPLVALTSLYAMRQLGIRYSIALTGSLLFAFTSFHHWRLGPHIFFAVGYFTVPLATLLALRLFQDTPLLLVRGSSWWRPRWAGGRESWVAIAFCVVMGLTGTVYYPFFSCYLLLVAGVLSACRRRSTLPLVRSLCLSAVIGAMLVLDLLPTLWHQQVHGALSIVIRPPEDAEVYGLKIAQLILPGAGHEVHVLKRIGEIYNSRAPLVTENRTAYLGLVGIVGFLYLTFALLRGQHRDRRLGVLSQLNMAVLLLGTVGGFSSIFAFLVSPTIRAYNRISVYIAYFALLALALLAQRATSARVVTPWRRATLVVVLAIVLAVGLRDQFSFRFDYNAYRQRYLEGDQFIAQIEHRVPPNGLVYQFPYFSFPEHGPTEQLADYDLLLPYLHSSSIRWSYGAMKGRRADAWLARIAAMPTEQAVDTLAEAGFSGIYVARKGYADSGAQLEVALESLLGRPAAVSATGDASFFTLMRHASRLRATLGTQEFRRRGADALDSMYLGWRDGFYPPETSASRVWCGRRGRFVIENPAARPKQATLRSTLRVAKPPATVRIAGGLFEGTFVVDSSGYELSATFQVPPGEHFMQVKTVGGRWDVGIGGDRRVAFENTRLTVSGK
jgi:phosphoglycerol transferase